MKRNVTYLPHVKQDAVEKLEKIERLLQEEQYKDAVFLIKKLEKLQIEPITNSVIRGKLLALYGLEKWQSLERYCEEISSHFSITKTEDYIIAYGASLFYQAQYEEVINYIEEKLDEIELSPVSLKQLEQWYDLSKEEVTNEAKTLMTKFKHAIISENETAQWQLFHQWKKLGQPPPEMFEILLAEKAVNPFVKTKIIESLQDGNNEQEVIVKKFDQEAFIILTEIPPIAEHPIYIQTLKALSNIEQKNPTVYTFTLELLQRYIEYVYPFLYKKDEIYIVAEALEAIATEHLTGESTTHEKAVKNKITQIVTSNEAYFRLFLT